MTSIETVKVYPARDYCIFCAVVEMSCSKSVMVIIAVMLKLGLLQEENASFILILCATLAYAIWCLAYLFVTLNSLSNEDNLIQDNFKDIASVINLLEAS